MRRLIYAAATALSLAGFGALAPAQALSVQPNIPAPTDIEQAQFVFGGHTFCFYPSGWNGPGFYWCGFAWNRGRGWGGGHGWNGWDHRRPPVHHWHGGGRPPHAGRPPSRPPHAGRPGGRPPHASGPPGGRPPHAGRPGGGRPGGHGGGPGGGGPRR